MLALRRPEPAAIDRAERAPTARSSLVLHDPAASPPDAPLGTEADAVARCVERIRRIEALPRGRDDAWVTDARRALAAIALRWEQDGSSERQRASGLSLRAALAWDEPVLAAARGASPGADTPLMLPPALQARADAAAQDARDRLVSLALTSADPAVYRTAYLRCVDLRFAGLGNCAQLSANEWARRDPGDGSAWLFVAYAAINRGDITAFDDAALFLRRAAPRLAELGGWPAAELEQLRNENDALAWQSRTQVDRLTDLESGCSQARTWRLDLAALADLGEAGVLLRQVRESGESVAAQARRWRDAHPQRAASPSADAARVGGSAPSAQR